MVTQNRNSSYLSPEKKRDIAELAEFVAEEYCPGVCIDPVVIVKAKGITLSFGAYKDAFDGLLEHQQGRFHIYCNLDRVERSGSPRARFTLGHELGHYFLDGHRNALRLGRAPAHPSFCEYESKNLVEQEADHFASCLLMPESRVTKQAKGLPAGLGSILRLSKAFGTSVTSTAVRYAVLRIKPCVVVKWSGGSFAWKWLSYEAREAGYRKTIETLTAILPQSATARALGGDTTPAAGYFQTGTTAGVWFPNIRGNEYRDIILLEQAVRLGRFGVLTILTPESGVFPWSGE
jgi:Zn-dependent peptidase ImmA (M78 family)